MLLSRKKYEKPVNNLFLIKNLVFHAQVLVRNRKRGFRVLLGSPHQDHLSKGCTGRRSSPNEEMGERDLGNSPSLGWSDLSSPSPKGNIEKPPDQAAYLFSALYFPWKRNLSTNSG